MQRIIIGGVLMIARKRAVEGESWAKSSKGFNQKIEMTNGTSVNGVFDRNSKRLKVPLADVIYKLASAGAIPVRGGLVVLLSPGVVERMNKGGDTAVPPALG